MTVMRAEEEAAFLAAIEEGDVGAVRRLIEQVRDASANMMVTLTWEVFHRYTITQPRMAADYVFVSALHAAAAFGAIDVVELLLEKKAHINKTSGTLGETPLVVALKRSFFQLADALLQHGADTNIGNRDSGSPLELCCCATHAHFIPTLLRYGAFIEGSERKNWTPLHEACENGDLQSASILVAHGADVNARNRDDRSPIFNVIENPDIMRMLIANGAQVNLQDDNGETPLHCVGNNLGCCDLLLSNNASVDTQTIDGITPLHAAVVHDRYEVVRVFLTHQRSRYGQDGVGSLLLKSEGYHGWNNGTMLHLARSGKTARRLVEHCRCEDGTLLAACHQFMFARDDYGRTPLDRARGRAGADEVVEYLESFTMRTLATPAAYCPNDSVAVMLNPKLDDFQRAIAVDCLDLIRGSNSLDVPDAALYVMLAYLSPSDAMKR